MEILLAVAGCAHAPWHPYRGWTAVQEEGVVLYTDTRVEHRPALDWMVGISEAYRRTFFRDLRVAPVHALYLQEDAPSPLEKANGDYRYGATLLSLPRAPDGGRGLVVVGRFQWQWEYAHLVAHHFIAQAIPAAPPWFQEGFARYLTLFRGSSSDPGVLCFGLRQPAEGSMVTPPIGSVFEATWRDFNDTASLWMAPASWAFIDFLLHGDHGHWRARFRPFMDALITRQTTEAALAAVYPDLPRDSLDERLRLHVRTIRPPNEDCPLPVAVAPRTPPAAPPSATPVPEDAIRAIFQSIDQLPAKQGYADWVP
jgi:hypothetical protein